MVGFENFLYYNNLTVGRSDNNVLYITGEYSFWTTEEIDHQQIGHKEERREQAIEHYTLWQIEPQQESGQCKNGKTRNKDFSTLSMYSIVL